MSSFCSSESYEEAQARGIADLTPISAYNEDYHIFQTTKEEDVMRAIRNGLNGADIPVENSKGEADAGQEEINVRYADALTMADRHAIIKNACKEIAWSKGRAHQLHGEMALPMRGQLLACAPVLCGTTASLCSSTRRPSTACRKPCGITWPGCCSNASDITYFLAPYINSYKRFAAGTFAPTKAIWSMDNRTAGYRVCGDGHQGGARRVPGRRRRL